MKMWQLLGLLAAIYIAPHLHRKIGETLGVVCLILAVVFGYFKE